MNRIQFFKIVAIVVLVHLISGCEDSDSTLPELYRVAVGDGEMDITYKQVKQMETTISIRMGNGTEQIDILLDATSDGTYQIGGSSTNSASYFDGTNLYTTDNGAQGTLIIETLDANSIQASFDFNVEYEGQKLQCKGELSLQIVVLQEFLMAKVNGVVWEATDWISVDTLAGYLSVRGDHNNNQILMTAIKQQGTQQFGQVIEDLNFMTSANYNTSLSNYSTAELGSNNTGYITIEDYTDEYVKGTFYFNGYEGTSTGYDPESEMIVSEGRFKINWGHY